MPTYQIQVNGKPQTVDVDSDTPLLYALRDNLGLHGPKFGCGMGQCGACTVLFNGTATRSCVIPVSAIGEARITTLEGLGTPERPHPVQQAFIDEQAVQCGYCINGMVMTSVGLLTQHPKPTDTQIRDALAGNLCRCGTHARIVRAVKRAAGTATPAKEA